MSEQIAFANKGKGRKKKGTSKTHKMLGIHDKRNAFAVKFYEEQLPCGEQDFFNRIKNIQCYFSNEIYVIAIKHDNDEVTDGLWALATEKHHYHMLIKAKNYKTSLRISAVLGALGIIFRQGIDDSLIENHGIETIGNWNAYVAYLTHETDDAISDGKFMYSHDRIISNLSDEKIRDFRDKYFGAKKVKTAEMSELDKEAYALGYNLEDFDEWYDNLPYDARKKSEMRTIRESYYRGVAKYEKENNEVLRLCIYIQGKHNAGKTYNATKALEQIFSSEQIYHVKHGGSGQFDRFQSHMKAIIADDYGLGNLLNIADNCSCQLKRRNSDNPLWVGTHLVVTSNYSFLEWLEEKCGFHVKNKNGEVAETYNAVLSRFYVCHIAINEKGVNELVLDSPSTRGTLEDIKKRDLMFQEFQKNFNNSISTYAPCVNNQSHTTAVSDWALTQEEKTKFSKYISNYVFTKISESEEFTELLSAHEKDVVDELKKEKQIEENRSSDFDSYYTEMYKFKTENLEKSRLFQNEYSSKKNEIYASILTELLNMRKGNSLWEEKN